MPGLTERMDEMELRLMNLIEILADEYEDCPEPPDEAAAEWTEAEIRAFFSSNGEILPGPVEDEDAAKPASTQPGGAAEPNPEEDDWKNAPQAYHDGLAKVTCEDYQRIALAEGIPDRPHGLFPPNDPVLAKLAKTRGLKPFQKCCVGGSGQLELVNDSWGVGNEACVKGIDLRYFLDVSTIDNPEGNRLVGAVRFADTTAIGTGFWTSAHGGAVETVLDEITAEIVKICQAATGVTIEAKFTLKKACPLNTTLLCEATTTKSQSDGFRIHTEGKITDPDGTLYASCQAQLVDYGRIRKETNTLSPHLQ